MTVRVLLGHVLDRLLELDDQSIHCCITSPPYWSLRDYGTPPVKWPAIRYAPLPGSSAIVRVPKMVCSLGLEPTLEAFIGHIVLVFRQVRRVLRDDGTLWVNMGDSYAGDRDPKARQSDVITGTKTSASAAAAAVMKRQSTDSRRRDRVEVPRSDRKIPGLKEKDMVMQPARVALALQADGWWLRRDVIWHKLNPMPESAKDRPTTSHEYLWLLSKSATYYYDHEAIKEPCSEDTHARYARGRSDTHKYAEVAAVPGAAQQTIAQGFEHMRAAGRMLREGQQRVPSGWDTSVGGHRELAGRYTHDGSRLVDGAAGDGKGERMGREPGWRRKNAEHGLGIKANHSFDAAMTVMPEMRNKRSVWPIATEAFRGAHFATFPTALVEPCIKAGCPEGGTVLDCFGGSGTTGMVADRLQRHAVLVELNAKYGGDMAADRIKGDAPLFADVRVDGCPAT